MEDAAAHSPMESAHPVHRATAAHREISQVERLRRIVWIESSQGHQPGHSDPEALVGVLV